MLKLAPLAALSLPLLMQSGQVQGSVPDTTVTASAARCSTSSLPAGLPDGVRLTRAEMMQAGPALTGSGGTNGNSTSRGALVGAHCLLQGKFEERVGAGGKPYAIGFELRIPMQWNGRLLYQGGGGFNGVVRPAIGNNVSNGSTAQVALARGYAVVSTDSGHEGTDAAFAADQIAKINYAYAAIGKVTRLARQLVVQISGSLPTRTYFQGCSNGGREAMIAAQRHAELFDGVVAGDPAFNLSGAAVMANYSQQSFATIAPRGVDGRPVLARALTDTDVRILSRGILAACDALDGARDGLVFNHAACRFDPGEVKCRPGRASDCLAPAKVVAIRTAFRGPLTRQGKPVVSSWVYDAGVAGDNWRAWQTGTVGPDGSLNTILPGVVNDSLARYFTYPALGAEAVRQGDAVTLLAATEPTASLTNSTMTEMSSFVAKGGKMLLVTGWSDPIFTPHDLIAWYERLKRDTQGAGGGEASDFARLFLVPGMTHCGGGPALDDFDALSVLVDWVEKGQAPSSFPARGRTFPGVSRPICAYPKRATYRRGPINDSESFVCA